MPTMGYQEFVLPKFNAMDKKHDIHIITGNKYYPVPNYNKTWKNFLGDRTFPPKIQKIDSVKIKRNKILFEIAKRPWISNLEKDIISLNPDIIMCHGTTSFTSLRAVLIAKKLEIPLLFDNHMIFSIAKKNFLGKIYYFILRKFISKFFNKHSNLIFGVTNETCKYLIELEGYPKSKVKLLPLGTDSSVFYPKIKKIKKKIRIIQTGKLNFDKRPDILAKAALIMIKEGYDIELIFYGSGDEKMIQNIKDLFFTARQASRLKFKNLQKYKKLGDIYNQADLVVFPFGTSLSAIDAAFCGIPVVMTDDAASKEKSKDGIGICYKAGDINDLVKKIKILINNRNKQNTKFSKKKLQNIKKKYDYKFISDHFLSICEREIKKKNIQKNKLVN